MFNVDQITSRLAEMSDAQLSQYARMHKDDPYILPLAAAESKRRQRLRQNAQPQQAPTQTVADQTIQQMQLPEEQGIGMLPAQNLETMNMADGGIVAFADGGSLTPEEQAELDARRRSYFGNIIPNVKERVGRWWENVQQIPWESKSPMIKYGTPKYTGIMEYERPKEALERMRKEDQDVGGGGYKGQDFVAAGAVSPQTPAVDTTSTPTFTDARTKPPVAEKAPAKKKEAGIAAIAPTPAAPTPSLQEAYKQSQGFGDNKDIINRLDQYEKDIQSQMEAERRRREESRPQGKAGEKYEAQLMKEEEKDKQREARNLNLALINAGLAIAGGKSQYALQNIAEGAQVGTKQYKEGIEKLEESARLRAKEIAAIEEARRAEARGDWDKQNAFEEKIISLRSEGKKLGIEALSKIYDTDKKIAGDIYNTAVTNASREKISAQQNAAELQKARIMAAAYGDRAMNRGEITPALALKEYNDLLQKDLLGDFKKQFPTFESYMAALRGQHTPAPGAGGIKFLGFEK